ncbi:MAG: Mur ligase family protein [Longimicrobiales bacterium]
MTTLLFCFTLWLGFLAVEAYRLRRWSDAIPVRIAVTGTRGKSSVVRMLAAALREDGWRVVAKTTGAEAALILPDGSERPVRRRGRPSILEQVGVVGLAARLRADALVAEVMSVHAENHRVEGRRILRPHLVLATNFRVDHVEAQGRTGAEVAEVLALGVPAGGRALVPEGAWEEAFAARVRAEGGSLGKVAAGTSGMGPDRLDWSPNLDLVLAAARELGVEESVSMKGVRDARMDIGQARAWRYPARGGGEAWRVVNCFAANDPESTLLAYDRVFGAEGGEGDGPSGKPVGLLSLRGDRGDRSLLWANVLAQGALSRFSRPYVHGFHATAVRRRLRRPGGPDVAVLPVSSPEEVMERIATGGNGEAGEGGNRGGALFGFGNLGGLGEAMVRHWMEAGEPLPGGRTGVRRSRPGDPSTGRGTGKGGPLGH